MNYSEKTLYQKINLIICEKNWLYATLIFMPHKASKDNTGYKTNNCKFKQNYLTFQK